MWRTCRNCFCLVFCAWLLSSCASFPEYSNLTPQYHRSAPEHSPLQQWQPSSVASTSVTDLTSVPTLPDASGQQAGLKLLGDGLDAFIARLALTQAATSTLDLQYYLYHDDLTGRALTLALLQAADRGVRVRLLLDDMATRGKDEALFQVAAHPNIDIRFFNPFHREYSRELQFITRYGVSTRRMHNKAMIADNLMAIVGGRNIGDEYFNAARDDVVFGDLDVLFTGPVVSDASVSFDRYWNSSLSFPVEQLYQEDISAEQLTTSRQKLEQWAQNKQQHPYLKALKKRAGELVSDLGLKTGVEVGSGSVPSSGQELRQGKAYLLGDSPDKLLEPESHSAVFDNISQISDQTTESLLVVSPYFVPGDEGVKYLKQLVDRGVEVTVLTNSLAATDVPAVHSAYKKYRRGLLQGGIRLWELKPDLRQEPVTSWSGSSSASLHAKMLVADQRYIFVGSMNLDPRSVVENTEMGLLFEQAQMATEIRRVMAQQLPTQAYRLSLQDNQLTWHEQRQDGVEKTYDSDPQASSWRRLQSWFLGWLPIESEL